MKSDSAPPARPNWGPTRRGLSLLLIAYLVTAAASMVAGALHAQLLDRLLHHGESLAAGALSLGVVSTLWQAAHVVTSLLVLVGLAELGKSPPATRVASAAQVALIVTLVELLLGLLNSAVGQALRFADLGPHEISRIMMGIALIDTIVYGVSVVLIVEVLLRLRRHATLEPADARQAESEALWRGGIIALLIARALVSNLAPTLAGFLFHGALRTEWASYVLRTPCTLLLYGVLIWLLQTTEKLLRD